MWPFGKSTVDRVKDAFKAQALLAPLNLDARVDGGTVFVTGSVPTDKYGGLVRVVASGIDGVKDVDISGLIPAAQSPATHTDSVHFRKSYGNFQNRYQAALTLPEASVEIGAVDIGTRSEGTELQASQPTAPAYDDAQADKIVAQAVAEHTRIAKGVWNAIKADGELKDDPINVMQRGSSIILTGAVDSEHELHLTANLARSISDVEAVDASGLKVVGGTRELVKEKNAGGDTVYTIQAGDTLIAVALKHFGNAGRYKDIFHYNNLPNPDDIKVGQQIRISG